MLRLHCKSSGLHKAGLPPTRKRLDYLSWRLVHRDLAVPAETILFVQQNSRSRLPHTKIEGCHSGEVQHCIRTTLCEVFVLTTNLQLQKQHPALIPLPKGLRGTTTPTCSFQRTRLLPLQYQRPPASPVGHTAMTTARNRSVAASQGHPPHIASRLQRRKKYVFPKPNTGCRGRRQYLGPMAENIFRVADHHWHYPPHLQTLWNTMAP